MTCTELLYRSSAPGENWQGTFPIGSKQEAFMFL